MPLIDFFNNLKGKYYAVLGPHEWANGNRNGMENARILEEIIEEIEFGEKRAIEDYEKVLKENTMLLTTRNLLTKQLNQIKEDLSNLKDLKKRVQSLHA